MPATREHLLMVLADLDDILIRASYSNEMLSSSISDIRMEVAVPNYSGLAQALEVEQCRCPPGYQGLSCQVSQSDSFFPFIKMLIHWFNTFNHCVSLRIVLLDTLAPEEVYTWAIVSSVNATGTLTPATLRLASAR